MEERTKAGNQLYFGKIEALQPKKYKIDKGSAALPLFEQQQEDKNQLDIFGSERTAPKAKYEAEVYRINKKLEPEKINSIKGNTSEEIKAAFFNVLDHYLNWHDYLVLEDTTSIIGIYAKRADYNYYIKLKENRQ